MKPCFQEGYGAFVERNDVDVIDLLHTMTIVTTDFNSVYCLMLVNRLTKLPVMLK